MTIYLNGLPKQVSLRPFDVVFLGGNPTHPHPPPFEHVALVGHSSHISEAGDWMKLGVYGLPESLDATDGEGLGLGSVQRWKNKFIPREESQTAPLGHPESGWNLVMRLDIDEYEADFRILNAARYMGSLSYQYGNHYEVRIDTEQGSRCTNCLGFVVDLLTRHIKFKGIVRPPLATTSPLVDSLPEYTIMYSFPQKRTTPSIGHLAHSLDRAVRTHPFGLGLNSGEAEAKALAKAFITGKTQT